MYNKMLLVTMQAVHTHFSRCQPQSLYNVSVSRLELVLALVSGHLDRAAVRLDVSLYGVQVAVLVNSIDLIKTPTITSFKKCTVGVYSLRINSHSSEI